MRTALVAALSLGVLVAGPASATGDREASGKAKLTLQRGTPLALRGTKFLPRERVRLVVVTRKRITKRLSANASGAFVVRFVDVSIDRCSGFSAFAVGARGSRASISSPNVYCPPPL